MIISCPSMNKNKTTKKWLFKKKTSHDDFQRFKTNVKKSFRKYKKDIMQLNQKCEFLRKKLNKVKPLSTRFSEL